MQIKFLGAAGTVTGSCYVVTPQSGQPIMIDCGLFQGGEDLEKLNYIPLEYDCTQLAGVVLTHAHLDHCGRIPTLLAQGFHQSIWMTAATKEITEISLFDAAQIHTQDREKAPLYEKEQVEKVVELFKTVEYEETLTIGQFRIVLRDA